MQRWTIQVDYRYHGDDTPTMLYGCFTHYLKAKKTAESWERAINNQVALRDQVYCHPIELLPATARQRLTDWLVPSDA